MNEEFNFDNFKQPTEKDLFNIHHQMVQVKKIEKLYHEAMAGKITPEELQRRANKIAEEEVDMSDFPHTPVEHQLFPFHLN